MKNVLIVDDDRMTRHFMEDIFQLKGYSVRVASSTEEAMDILSDYRFDLIITDLYMPGRSGMVLAKTIKDRGCGTPIIMITGYGNDDVYVLAEEAGISKVLEKPFSLDVLMKTVGDLMSDETDLKISKGGKGR